MTAPVPRCGEQSPWQRCSRQEEMLPQTRRAMGKPRGLAPARPSKATSRYLPLPQLGGSAQPRLVSLDGYDSPAKAEMKPIRKPRF